ncbi:MAG: iron-containing alcohol dehydrogenase [Acidobacteriota bacterium]
MRDFRFHTPPAVVFEDGAAERLGPLLAAQLSGRVGDTVLVVTDPGLRRLGLPDAALASLEATARVVVFDRVEADPSRATLAAAVELGRAVGASSVVGFGGGSSLDVAKVAALLLGSGEDLEAAWGVGNARGPRLPLALVPTTAGTGSEVTPVAILTVEGAEKRGVSSPVLLPDLAVLDPLLTLSLPPAITAATGIDAMVHAIEAYASKNANNNPMSRALAREALRLLGGHLETAVRDGADRDARAAMLLGSMLAGQAFANSPVAAVHALAYPIGGLFHVPHGLSNALVLPHVLRFNAADTDNGSEALYADLAPHVFADVEELAATGDASACCTVFVDRLGGLCAALGLPRTLREVGVGEGDLERMARDAMKQQRLLVNNPREVTEADALAIYRAAW